MERVGVVSDVDSGKELSSDMVKMETNDHFRESNKHEGYTRKHECFNYSASEPQYTAADSPTPNASTPMRTAMIASFCFMASANSSFIWRINASFSLCVTLR